MSEMVKVETIMKNLNLSVDGFITHDHETGRTVVDFASLIERKSQDWSFWALAFHLADGGEWTDPICITIKKYLDGTPDGWELGNGHHRLAVAILLCLDEIPVHFSTDGDWMCSYVTEVHQDYMNELTALVPYEKGIEYRIAFEEMGCFEF